MLSERTHPIDTSWFPPQGQWTYEDWLKLPDDDGWKYEVIKGELFMSPSPGSTHQNTSLELVWLMMNFVKRHKVGQLFEAPYDVYLPGQDSVVQPDIIFIASERRNIITEKGVEGAPDLVIEIMSPSNKRYDRRVKLPLYEEAGVREFWLVDPEQQTVEVYVLRDEQYTLLGNWGMGEVATSEVLAGFTISVDDIMQGYLK